MKPDITDVDYNVLVDISERLVDQVGENENHKLTDLLNSVGELIFEYEEYHFGDVSIGINKLHINYDSIYTFMAGESVSKDLWKLSGTLTHGEDELPFCGYYSFERDYIKFSDPIRGQVGFTTFSKYKQFQVEYDSRFFSVFLGHIFRTGRYNYLDKLESDFAEENDLYLERCTPPEVLLVGQLY